MKVALVIGHNSRSKGAFSSIIGTEYDYWKRIAEKIKAEIPNLVDIYERQPNESYLKEMRKVINEMDKHDYKYCLELHFNASSSEKSNGCECIIYKGNKKAEVLATQFMARLQNNFGSKIRIKENTIITTKEKGQEEKIEEKVRTHGLILVQDSSTRGGYGICKSRHTYLLLEPFFGSNPDESLKFADEQKVVDLFVKYIKEVQV